MKLCFLKSNLLTTENFQIALTETNETLIIRQSLKESNKFSSLAFASSVFQGALFHSIKKFPQSSGHRVERITRNFRSKMFDKNIKFKAKSESGSWKRECLLSVSSCYINRLAFLMLWKIKFAIFWKVKNFPFPWKKALANKIHYIRGLNFMLCHRIRH